MAFTAIVEFFAFSLIGWVIDSAYRSFTDGKLVWAGYFRLLPICPIYGVGGLVLLYFLKYSGAIPTFLQILIGAVLMVLVEYAGGIFSERVLNVRLWDYSLRRWHIGGHIDGLHSLYWLVLVIFFYYVLYVPSLAFEHAVQIPDFIEFPTLLIVIIGFLWVIVRKNPYNFLKFKGKVLNMSVQQYGALFASFCRYRCASVRARARLYGLLKKQLHHTGARLKRTSGRKLYK